MPGAKAKRFTETPPLARGRRLGYDKKEIDPKILDKSINNLTAEEEKNGNIRRIENQTGKRIKRI